MSKSYLTLKQIASYLKVTDSVVKEMIHGDIFNGVKRGNSIVIDKTEVDEWLANLNEREFEQLALKRTVCRFTDYFKPKLILLDFEADNKYEAIAAISKHAKEMKIVKDNRWLYQVVVAREELVSTAVGKSVALLHPRHFHPSKIKKPAILFARSKEPIEFDAIDNKPVNLFFMLLLHDDMQHLFSISFISKFLMNDDNLKNLATAETKEEIEKLLTKSIR